MSSSDSSGLCRLVVFDLDGTLVDTGRDIANAVNRALQTCGRPRREVDEIRSFLGAGARRLVELALDTRDTGAEDIAEDAGTEDTGTEDIDTAESTGERTAEQVDHALELFARYYERDLVVESRPFNGVDELLRDLTQSGREVAVLSNKPHHLTVRVVEALFETVPWVRVLGHRPGHARKPDPAGLLEICRELGVLPEESALVGDTHFDVRAAVAAGAQPIGVTWGGTPADELYRHGARRVTADADDIARWILASPE